MIKHVLSGIALLAGLNAFATKHVVTSSADAGSGSLRDQITNATGGDTIVFDATLNGSTITLTSGEIAFSKSLTIIGPGAMNLTLSGNQSSRIFYNNGGDLSVSGLSLIDCKLTGTLLYHGGAIKQETLGNLYLKDVRFENNDSRQSNGSQGGAVFYAVNDGRVIVDSCFFGNNKADNYGGAMSTNGSADFVHLINCWFNSNSATGTCGAFYSNADTMTIEGTTFSNNYSNSIASVWNGSSYDFNSVHITNSTFSYNYATIPNAIFEQERGELVLVNNTFQKDNEPITFGDDHESDTFYFTVHNNIFNLDGLNLRRIDAVIKHTTLGGNLSSDTSMGFFLTNTNDTNEVDPMLATLRNEDALAEVHMLLPGSPAIKNGTPGGPLTDQVGRMRTYMDAGAVDFICPTAYGTHTVSACVSFEWIDGNTYTANNTTATYMYIDGAASGCDSIVTLNLTINPLPDNSATRNGRTLTATSTTASYVWLDCEDNMNPVGNETMQSFTVSKSGNYAVEVTENGCKDTSSCISVNLSGIEDNSFAAGVQVYPNPSTGIVNLEFAQLQGHLTVDLRTVTGQTLRTYEINQENSLQIELNQKAGIYFLVMHNEEGQQAIIKLIKE